MGAGGALGDGELAGDLPVVAPSAIRVSTSRSRAIRLSAACWLAVALAGFLLIYDCSHAIGHYLAGRAVGIGSGSTGSAAPITPRITRPGSGS